MGLVLGIDLGTSGVKCIAIDHEARVVARASAGYPLLLPRPGWIEQNPEDWWKATCQAVKACLQQIPDAQANVEAVGLSGHMSGLVLLDRTGKPVRPCILLADSRSMEETSWLATHLGDEIARRTGNVPLDAFLAPKLLWVKRHEPAAYNGASWVLFPKDYIRYRLTGRFATEPTDAGNSLFYRYEAADPAGSWDEEMVSWMGLNLRLLPPLVPTTAVAGKVTREAAESTGLPAGTPVAAGGGDMACSAVGTGATVPGVVAVTIGTAAQVVTVVPGPSAAGRGQVTFHPHAVPGAMYSMGSILTGGLGMSWLAGVASSVRQPSPRPAAEPAVTPADLGDFAAQVPPGSDGLLCLPFLVGRGSPDFNARVRGAWIGLSGSKDFRHLARSVMEGVAFNLKDSLRVFEAMGIRVSRIHIGGGGAASPVWRQILADVFNHPVHPLQAADASALGAALVAGVGAGIFPNVQAAAERAVHVGPPVMPQPESVSVYKTLYDVYLQAYEALKPVFAALGNILVEGKMSR
ncbi:MAG: xylulokinase [Firmicutes bacterium]|nr:xylulokinase [Bacillota bacterium]